MTVLLLRWRVRSPGLSLPADSMPLSTTPMGVSPLMELLATDCGDTNWSCTSTEPEELAECRPEGTGGDLDGTDARDVSEDADTLAVVAVDEAAPPAGDALMPTGAVLG